MGSHGGRPAYDDLTHGRTPLGDLDYQRLGCAALGVLHRHKELAGLARYHLAVVVGRLAVWRLFRVLGGNGLAGGNEAASLLPLDLIEPPDRLGRHRLPLPLLGSERQVRAVVRKLDEMPLQPLVIPVFPSDLHDVGDDFVIDI